MSNIKKKNGIPVVEPYLDTWHAEFQVDKSIFGKHIAQKIYPLMTSFFQTAILSIPKHRTGIKKLLFPRIQGSNWYRNEIFENANSEIWLYVTRGWPGPSMSFTCVGSDLKWLSFWILQAKVTINHVPHAWKGFFYFSDLSWPNLDPNLYLVWHLCSQGIFTSPLRLLWLSIEWKLSILPALGFIIQKR